MPKLSVVIPTFNRAHLLSQTIDHIESQTVSADTYEVIVIDNSSTDRTPALLKEKARRHANLRCGVQDKRGAAATRNEGIRRAKGEIVLFIDDDILADPDLVRQHIAMHAANPNSSVIGTVVSPWDDRTEPFLRYLRDRRIFNPYSLAGGSMDFSYYHTGNVSTPRHVLEEVGGFDEGFTVYGMEDIELGYRLEKHGCRMVHGMNARGVHQYFPTHGQFVERCRQAGYSLGRMCELHPELRTRFVEHGKATRLLKRFHRLYKLFEKAARPLVSTMSSLESLRGAGPVNRMLDQHFYWSVRYHFFLGYTEFNRQARLRPEGPRVGQSSRQRISELAIENRSKGVSRRPIAS